MIEFNINDIVTFHAYHKPIKAKVVGIRHGNPSCPSGNDDRIFYSLSGVSAPLVSITTGKCIVESSLFDRSDLSAI